MWINISMKFHADILKSFQVTERKRVCHWNYYLQCSKGITQKIYIQESWFSRSAHRLMLDNIFMKFHEEFSSYRADTILWRRGQTDRRQRQKQYEPPHDKTNKMICAPSEDSDQPPQADLSLMTKPTKWSVRPAKTQISLGAQSFCWFCHEAAYMSLDPEVGRHKNKPPNKKPPNTKNCIYN